LTSLNSGMWGMVLDLGYFLKSVNGGEDLLLKVLSFKTEKIDM